MLELDSFGPGERRAGRPKWTLIAIAAQGLIVLAGCTLTGEESQGHTASVPAEVDPATATIRCMEERGYEASPDGMGGLNGPELPPGQSRDGWAEAVNACREETGWGIENYDDEQLATLYELEVEHYECLVAEGFTPEPPPSVQAYIDSWSSRTESPYQAFATVAQGMGQGAYMGMIKLCPPPRWTYTG